MKWKIGNVTVTKVKEVELPGLRFLIPECVPENLEKLPWLAPHFVNEKWKPMASIHTLIVETMGQKVLVDTCLGNDKQLAMEAWSNRTGPFLQDLSDAGHPRESIDKVLCTHLHPDHIGWNTMLKDDVWVPTFDNAQYIFGRVEWEHFSALEDETNKIMCEQSVQPIVDADKHTLVETDYKISDEVWLEPTPGHTPGHVSVHIKSDGKEAVISGDCMHHPSQMAHPEWKCTFDNDAAQAQATRRSFCGKYSGTPTLIIGTHFAGVTAGHIVADGDVWRFEA